MARADKRRILGSFVDAQRKPIVYGRGMIEEEATRSRIRFLIETGDLPCNETGQIWAGQGDGKHCAACLELIATTDVEFEVDLASGRTVRFHRHCHDLWLEECDPVTMDRR